MEEILLDYGIAKAMNEVADDEGINLEEAAKVAMIRAKKIAEATDGDLGTMRNARMGVLQITPKNSNMVSDYGVNDLSSIEKEITAVGNASFEIR